MLPTSTGVFRTTAKMLSPIRRDSEGPPKFFPQMLVRFGRTGKTLRPKYSCDSMNLAVRDAAARILRK